MKITVINATEIKGITFRAKEMFLEQFKDSAEITEFYLPKDCPSFCIGCKSCFLRGEDKCKDFEYIQKIDKALKEADLIVMASPAYVFHTTGAMKAMLDHLAYRWMPHRPSKEMFTKRAVVITQALGAGEKSAAKDIKDSLSWWGISEIYSTSFKLMSDVVWDKIPEKKQIAIESNIKKLATKVSKIDFAKPAKTNLLAKLKFFMVRMMQTGLGKDNPEYLDFKYWKEQGWIDKVRPWKK